MPALNILITLNYVILQQVQNINDSVLEQQTR